jgi:hypothetical protein
MAYDRIAQADRDVLSEGSNSVVSASPPSGHSFRPISLELENLGGDLSIEPRMTGENSDTRLGSMIRSMASTGTSYDMLEDDDYEDIGQTPVKNKSKNTNIEREPSIRLQPHSTSPKGIGRTRTASIGSRLPLRHPTPDLQSMQGAYVKNVERLEESAERLSMTSSLAEELRKMKFGQRQEQRQSSAPVGHTTSVRHTSRQVSASSLSNSILGINISAGPVGPPTSKQLKSPQGSVRSGLWSQASNSGIPTSKGSSYAQPLPSHEIGQFPAQHARQHVSFDLEPPQPPPHTYQPNTLSPRISTAQPALANGTEVDQVRPSTSASNDTYRQATTLFADFDGVHHTSHSHLSPSGQGPMARQVAISQPPLAADAAAFDEPPHGEGVVYYPAPVPMMLNLPQKLSKQPSPAERERRRLKALSTMPDEMRKSAAWLNEMEKTKSATGLRTLDALSNLPPQLRASAFFDRPGLAQDFDIKCSSAVDTLDSILDASAHAPVSAFTDHPFAGHLGGAVYGARKGHRKSATLERKKKRRGSLTNLLRTSTGLTQDAKGMRPASSAGLSAASLNKLKKRRSKNELNEVEVALANGEDSSLRTPVDLDEEANELKKPDAVDSEGEDSEDEDEDEAEEDDEGRDSDVPACSGPPTTLLAELQMRKAQQKLRNRTAANAFPNGMHSTLLELDAVAQVQQKTRKKKHITLAWEDHEIGDPVEFDDDDVPLGLLVAGQKVQQTIDRPMGLMAKREMEDNEPLSRRRARLRGHDGNRPATGRSEQKRASTMYTLDIPALAENVLEEQESETLAQRIQRIKAEKGTATGIGTDFSREVSSQLGLKTENVVPIESTTPEAEETLGQRRRRLQEEALQNSRQLSGGSVQNILGVKTRSSMADILTQHPAASARKPSNETKGLTQQQTRPPNHPQPESRLNHVHVSQQPQRMTSSYIAPGMMPSYPSFNSGTPFMNGVIGFNYNSTMMYSPGLAMQMGGYSHNPYLHDPIMMGPPLDPKQRDMIDRWRQGVAP